MNAEQEQRSIQAARRDPERFAPLYEHYFADIFRFLHRRANDRELTADLTQQTFLKAMLALPKYESRGLPFKAWLYRIALNEIRMHWRKRKEVVMELDLLDVRALVQEVGMEEHQPEDLHRLTRGMGRLNDRFIVILDLDSLLCVEELAQAAAAATALAPVSDGSQPAPESVLAG